MLIVLFSVAADFRDVVLIVDDVEDICCGLFVDPAVG